MGVQEDMMKVDRPRPSLWWIVKSDITSRFTVLFAIGWVLIWSSAALFGRRPANVPVYIMGVLLITLCFLLMLIWRVRLIRGTFAHGEEVTGRLTEVSYHTPVANPYLASHFFGRIGFPYVYGGMRYNARKLIYRTLKTAAMVKGDEVSIFVDRLAPRRAYIRDMFV
jgi:hypothetical protein